MKTLAEDHAVYTADDLSLPDIPAFAMAPPVMSRPHGAKSPFLSREQALQFARRIQPLLVNNCTAAGCHGRDSETGFRLSKVPTTP